MLYKSSNTTKSMSKTRNQRPVLKLALIYIRSLSQVHAFVTLWYKREELNNSSTFFFLVKFCGTVGLQIQF